MALLQSSQRQRRAQAKVATLAIEPNTIVWLRFINGVRRLVTIKEETKTHFKITRGANIHKENVTTIEHARDDYGTRRPLRELDNLDFTAEA